jgi:hypothetical protein
MASVPHEGGIDRYPAPRRGAESDTYFAQKTQTGGLSVNPSSFSTISADIVEKVDFLQRVIFLRAVEAHTEN